MSNSTHKVEVFRVEHLEKHPNADTLSIMRVFDNYQSVVRTSDYKIGDLVCYVPPDNILPDKPEYAFLKGKFRIKSTKLRGIVSQGLVLKAPTGATEGQDVAEMLGVTHYVSVPGSGSGGSGGGGSAGGQIAGPPIPGPKYDIDSWFRYGSLIPEGTMVEITEKLDGGNVRASYQDGKFWMGSRNHYREEDETGLYWKVMHQNPWLKRLCKQNPDCVVYGEVFGNVQDLRYGAANGQYFFRIFDILTPKGYMNVGQRKSALCRACVPIKQDHWRAKWDAFYTCVNEGGTVQEFLDSFKATAKTFNWEDCHAPVMYVGPYNEKVIRDLMDGPSTIPGAENEREGIVIKPVQEMWHPHIGRLILKAVSAEHLDKDKRQ